MKAKIAALLVSAAGLAVGAHAQTSHKLPFDLSPEDVETGFIMAVMDGCANAAETGRTLDQLNPYRIIRDTNRGVARAPKAGDTAWAPGIGVGVVEINDGPGGCEVSAYGASVTSTFNAVAQALIGRGYFAQAAGVAEAGSVRHELKRVVGGRTVQVALTGRDPGPPDPFSRISASVTVTSP